MSFIDTDTLACALAYYFSGKVVICMHACMRQCGHVHVCMCMCRCEHAGVLRKCV